MTTDSAAEAIICAVLLEVQVELDGGDLGELERAAKELRRLHDENRRLVNTLNHVSEVRSLLVEQRDKLLEALQAFPGFTDDAAAGDLWLEKMRAAIAKATGE